MRICVFEDAGCSTLEPLTLTRPAFDLRCGAMSLLERHVRRFGATEVGAVVRPPLADLCRLTHPEMSVNDPDWLRRGPVVLVNARWLPDADEAIPLGGPAVGMVDDATAYVVLPAGATDLAAETLARQREEWERTLARRDVGGALIAYPWHLIEYNGETISRDFRNRVAGRRPAPPGAAVVGPADQVCIDPAARVEPMTVIDATKGPVTIDRDAVVQAFSRIEGPCHVGPGTQILGAKVRGCSFGPNCRVGGEVESSILHSHANKAHDGFLGHSYVGEWANLGAGTQVSDLRNDYGPVCFSVGGRTIDSGRIKVGAFIGDHAKTSINALINTGTMVGPFGQLVADGGLTPRVVPAFCRVGHGRLQERADLREMFETAAVVMARRGQEWTATHAEFFIGLYERAEPERRQIIREAEQRRLRRVV